MSMHPTHADESRVSRQYLDLAARLAWRGQGRVEPNPLVGAVIVSGGRVIGVGHHRRYGGPHAEREALADCARRREDPRGSTMYVTLEPCRHTGKQPPCTEAIIAAGVARVVYARSDPNAPAAGGAEILRASGITTERCGASTLARGISDPFIKRITTGLPWVIAKWAQTIDGRVATRSGESKWISGEWARSRVHRLRARVDAIITGIGTVLADDPMLTARNVSFTRKTAARVIADTELDLPPGSAIARTARDFRTIVACDRDLFDAEISRERRERLIAGGVQILGVPIAPNGRGIDLRFLLSHLHRTEGFSTVMVESGPGLLGSMLRDDLIDEAVVYIAPLMLGDEMARAAAVGRVAETLTNAMRFNVWRIKTLDGDIEVTYRRR